MHLTCGKCQFISIIMLEELSKEIKAHLYDRARSPLFGAFVFAWLAWNFKAVLVLLSSMSYIERLDEFDRLYPTTSCWITHGALFPLLSAVAFILLYPFPARWIFQYWYSQHKKLKTIQQKIEDEMPMTQEEARSLRKVALEEQLLLQQQLREASVSNQELRSINQQLTQELSAHRKEFHEAVVGLREERDTLKEKVVSLDAELKAVSLNAFSNQSDSDQQENLGGQLASDGKQKRSMIASLIPDSVYADLLNKRSLMNNPRAVDVFLALVRFGGSAQASQLSKLLDRNPIDISAAINQLEQGKLAFSNGPICYLSDSGKALAVQMNLTDYVPHLG